MFYSCWDHSFCPAEPGGGLSLPLRRGGSKGEERGRSGWDWLGQSFLHRASNSSNSSQNHTDQVTPWPFPLLTKGVCRSHLPPAGPGAQEVLGTLGNQEV